MKQLEETIVQELLPILQATPHDRIALGLAIGLSLLFFESQDALRPLLTQLLADPTPVVRLVGVLGLGMAFVGHAERSDVLSL